MSNNKRQDIALIVGRYAIEQRFKPNSEKTREYKELSNHIAIYSTATDSYVSDMCYLKLQRIQLNRIIVDAVLHNLPRIQRMYMLMKYRENASSEKIECELNLSMPYHAIVWERSILRQIGNILLYKPNIEDIYCPKRIMNIINVLDNRINYIRESPKLYKRIGADWIEDLVQYRQIHSNILSRMNEISLNSDASSYNLILSEKFRNPHCSNLDICHKLYYSPTLVSKTIKRWENFVMEMFK